MGTGKQGCPHSDEERCLGPECQSMFHEFEEQVKARALPTSNGGAEACPCRRLKETQGGSQGSKAGIAQNSQPLTSQAIEHLNWKRC